MLGTADYISPEQVHDSDGVDTAPTFIVSA